MEDVSGNSFKPNEDISGDEYVSEPQSMEQYEETHESTVVVNDSFDYSNYFENIQSIGIFLALVLIGCMMAVCFILGFKKNE